MSAFGGKADMRIAVRMSAFDPKRTVTEHCVKAAGCIWSVDNHTPTSLLLNRPGLDGRAFIGVSPVGNEDSGNDENKPNDQYRRYRFAQHHTRQQYRRYRAERQVDHCAAR